MNSKKLSGNGLWESSRMLLPEHREALIQRRKEHPEQRSQMAVLEELVLIKNYAILPIMLTVVETSLRKTQTQVTDNALKKLYLVAANILIDRIVRDISETKKLLREQGIKVYEDEKIDGNLRVKFICRGYEDDIAIVRDVVKSEISIKIQRYIEEIAQQLSARGKS
ncbi:hypothetical protein [Paenibacillus lutrae]